MICPRERLNISLKHVVQNSAALILLVFFIAFVGGSAVAQSNFSEQGAAEIEAQARSASFEWTDVSVRRSFELYVQAAEAWRRLGAITRQCAALRNASRQRLILGDADGARQLLLTALRTEGQAGGLSGRTQTLGLLSRVALQLGRYRECEAYYKQALALARQTNDPTARGEAYYSASQFLYEKRAAEQSIHFNQQALAQFRLVKDNAYEAEVLVEQSYAYIMRRDFLLGIQLATQALAIAEQSHDRRNQANALIAIGNANITIGESRAAFDAYKRAEGLCASDLEPSKRAKIANGLGAIYEKYGDWEQSLKYRERALQCFQADSNKPGQLYTSISAGRLCHLVKSYDSAIRYLASGEMIARGLGDYFGLALIQIEQGKIRFSKEELDAARHYYHSALRIFEKLNDKLYLGLLQSYLGEVEAGSGHLDIAEKYYNTALKYNREINSHFAEADTLYHLAHLNLLQNRLESALQLIEQSLDISELMRGRVPSSRLRMSYFSEVHDRFGLYVDLLMRLHEQNPSAGYDARALQASERARARTLLDTLRMAGADFSAGADAALVEHEKQVRIDLTLKSDELTDLLNGANAHTAAATLLKNEIDNLSAEYDDIQARLREQSFQYQTLTTSGDFDLANFKNSILDDHTLLVEFFLGEQRSYLWLVSQTNTWSYVLPAEQAINEKTDRITRLLNDRAIHPGEDLEEYSERVAAAERAYWQEAQELSNWLLAQAADKLGNHRLIIVADKQLHYVSLAALPSPQADASQAPQDPFMLNHQIIYEPSASALLLLKSKFADASPAKTLLVLADPIFSLQDERLSDHTAIAGTLSQAQESLPTQDGRTERRVFLRLPATLREAESISSYISAGQTTILTGATATRENVLRTNFTDYKIVHFATHGLYDEKNPELSGIVLSKFDASGNPQNGYLLLNDIYRMHMPVDLVVLSACYSDRGKEVRGEGIVGLTRGFMQAGCKSVLSTLWKVDDVSTAEFMRDYYSLLLTEKYTPAEALRQAQVKMWQNPQWRSPFNWAPFILHGDFRYPVLSANGPKPLISLRWWALCLILSIGVMFLIGKRLLGRRRKRPL